MKYFSSSSRLRSSGLSWFFILQGGLLILLGLLIVMFPALLRVMVAGFFILIGVLVLGFGLTMRRAEQGISRGQDSFIDM